MVFGLLSHLAMSTITMDRAFQFVPYGKSFQSSNDQATISCDGRIHGGTTLELTHWTDNETPVDLYADTSTEMALKLDPTVLPNALVLNNHYDTDGVLSCWACLHPQEAREYADLLRQGAEAGDFGEWSSDAGIKLDAIIEGIGREMGDDEAVAYQVIFEKLAHILQDLTCNNGDTYQEYWKNTMDKVNQEWRDFQSGKVSLEAITPKLIACRSSQRISSFVLHRSMVSLGLWEEATRVLRINEKPNSEYSFEYEKVGHGWVQRLVTRRPSPSVDAKALVEALKSPWKTGGASGLVAICCTSKPVLTRPDQVAKLLLQNDQTIIS